MGKLIELKFVRSLLLARNRSPIVIVLELVLVLGIFKLEAALPRIYCLAPRHPVTTRKIRFLLSASSANIKASWETTYG
jgi:hypothetical protein